MTGPLAVILASPDADLAAHATDLAAESGTFTIAQVLPDTVSVTAALELGETDVVVLDASIGPLSALDLARDLTARSPDTALVLLTDTPSAEVLSRALHAGFRGVVGLPLQLEELSSTIEAAGTWARQLRERLAEPPEDRRGRMIVVAGAKGGVGTTTIATHLALEAQLANPDRRVCLVDFDLQAGDVRSLLDLTHHRSVDDLVEVAHEISARHLGDSLYAHPSGLRILLPPPQGEREGDITPEIARGILGAIRTRFDLVVADVGTVVTDGGSVATELADEVLLVTTPDVLSMRAAGRLVALWERRRYRKDDISVLVNRASRDSEVQPDLIARVLDLPLLDATVPSGFRDLEPAINTGVPSRLGDGPVHSGLLAVAQELRLVPKPRRQRLFARSDAGQLQLELLGWTPLVLAAILLLWQFVLAGWTASMGEHAAREAARLQAVERYSAAQVEQLREAAAASLPASLARDLRVELPAADRVRVEIGVPLLLPAWSSPWTLGIEQGTFLEPRL